MTRDTTATSAQMDKWQVKEEARQQAAASAYLGWRERFDGVTANMLTLSVCGRTQRERLRSREWVSERLALRPWDKDLAGEAYDKWIEGDDA